MLNSNTRNYLVVGKQICYASFKNNTANNLFHLQIIYIRKQDMELNNLHGLICYETESNSSQLACEYTNCICAEG